MVISIAQNLENKKNSDQHIVPPPLPLNGVRTMNHFILILLDLIANTSEVIILFLYTFLMHFSKD